MRALTVLAILAALLAPAATADHVYSHRFVFEGRVVGADGLPLPDREVEFFVEGNDTFDEPCPDAPEVVRTNAWGDFRFCFHKHELDYRVNVGVRVGNASVVKPMDTAFRRTVVALVDETENGTAPPGWNETFTLLGRAWRQGPTYLEGVPVFGLVATGVLVNVTLVLQDGSEQRWTSRTDEYGDFGLVFTLPEGSDPEGATLLVEAEGVLHRRELDLPHRQTTVGMRLGPTHGLGGDRVDGLQGDSAAGAPGRTAGPVPWGVVLGIVAVGGLLAFRGRRPRG